MGKRDYENIFKVWLTILGIAIIIYHVLNYFNNKNISSLVYAAQMIPGIAIIYVPQFASKIFNVKIPSILKYLYWTFILFAVFIGTGMQMYGKIFIWDKLLHFFSAMLLCSVGYALVGYYVNDDIIAEINPLLYTIFAFVFAIALGAFWEVYEFSGDGLFNLNMQRYMRAGEPFIGRVALYDTMSDIIVNTCGALIYAIICHAKLCKDKKWILNIAFQSTRKTNY